MPNQFDKFDEIANELLKNVSSSNDGEKEASILFINIYGVDRLIEQMEIETRVDLFNHYFTEA